MPSAVICAMMIVCPLITVLSPQPVDAALDTVLLPVDYVNTLRATSIYRCVLGPLPLSVALAPRGKAIIRSSRRPPGHGADALRHDFEPIHSGL